MPTPRHEQLKAVCEVCHAFTRKPLLLEQLHWLAGHMAELDFVGVTGRAITCTKCGELLEELGNSDSYSSIQEAVAGIRERYRKYSVDE